MVTDEQVALLRRLRREGATQEIAAAAAGMSVRTARAWEHGAFPSARKGPRTWRTRADPFAEVWSRVETILQGRPTPPRPRALLLELEREHPGRFGPGQLRTLQRRIRELRRPTVARPERAEAQAPSARPTAPATARRRGRALLQCSAVSSFDDWCLVTEGGNEVGHDDRDDEWLEMIDIDAIDRPDPSPSPEALYARYESLARLSLWSRRRHTVPVSSADRLMTAAHRSGLPRRPADDRRTPFRSPPPTG